MAEGVETTPDVAADRARFVRTLVRVLAVQAVTLAALWIMQRTFTP